MKGCEKTTMSKLDVEQRLHDIRKSKEELDLQSQQLQEYEMLQHTAESLRQKKDVNLSALTQYMAILEKSDIENSAREKYISIVSELQLKNDQIDAELEKVQKELEVSSSVLKQVRNFDKLRAFRNIRYLLKSSALKLGQIEREAGCQPGYMSRLEREGNTTDPSIEFLVTASKMLGVSLDVLLFASLSDLSPNEKYIIGFLRKLIKDTSADKLAWNVEPAAYLSRSVCDSNGNVIHPLFSWERYHEYFGEEAEYISEPVFCSRTYDIHTVIHGDCYNLVLQNGSVLYIMEVAHRVEAKNQNPFVRELWMVNYGKEPVFLCNDTHKDIISEKIQELYFAVSEQMKHPMMDKVTKAVIDAFLSDTLAELNLYKEEYEDNELPF